MLTQHGNVVGLTLIAIVLVAYGVRVAARVRPGWKLWGDVAAMVVVGVLVSLVALYASFWIIPDPGAESD